MKNLDEIGHRVSRVQHGFKEMKVSAEEIARDNAVEESLKIAKELYTSEKYQLRMVAVFVLGYLASRSKAALGILRSKVSLDSSWQVQEILAQAFNECAKGIGYQKALPIIKEWLSDKNPNVRRAVSEGLRIWNQKEYFRDNPEIAIKLLSSLKNDESEYVRRSAGNALRDISRKEKDLVKEELSSWDLSNPRVVFTYSLASKFL